MSVVSSCLGNVYFTLSVTLRLPPTPSLARRWHKIRPPFRSGDGVQVSLQESRGPVGVFERSCPGVDGKWHWQWRCRDRWSSLAHPVPHAQDSRLLSARFCSKSVCSSQWNLLFRVSLKLTTLVAGIVKSRDSRPNEVTAVTLCGDRRLQGLATGHDRQPASGLSQSALACVLSFRSN